MEERSRRIAMLSALLLLAMIAGAYFLDQAVHIGGLAAGGATASISLLGSQALILRYSRGRMGAGALAAASLLKLLIVAGVAVLLVLTAKVSLLGFALGFANVPAATALESMFGKISPKSPEDK